MKKLELCCGLIGVALIVGCACTVFGTEMTAVERAQLLVPFCAFLGLMATIVLQVGQNRIQHRELVESRKQQVLSAYLLGLIDEAKRAKDAVDRTSKQFETFAYETAYHSACREMNRVQQAIEPVAWTYIDELKLPREVVLFSCTKTFATTVLSLHHLDPVSEVYSNFEPIIRNAEQRLYRLTRADLDGRDDDLGIVTEMFQRLDAFRAAWQDNNREGRLKPHQTAVDEAAKLIQTAARRLHALTGSDSQVYTINRLLADMVQEQVIVGKVERVPECDAYW